MSRRVQTYLLIIMAAFLFFGCGRQQAVSTEPPGKLAGVIYDRRVGMVRGEDFYIHAEKDRVRSMTYFDMETADYIEAEDVPLEESSWDAIEASVLQMWPSLEEKVPQKKRSRLYWILNGFWNGEPMALDGGDRTEFSLVWETEEGTVTVPYRWDNSDPLYFELATLLKALAPQ